MNKKSSEFEKLIPVNVIGFVNSDSGFMPDESNRATPGQNSGDLPVDALDPDDLPF